MKRLRRASTSAAAVLVLTCLMDLPASAACPEGGVFKNLSYTSGDKGRHALKQLDVYAGPGISPLSPVVVYVHGGAWVGGDKAHVGDKPTFFNTRGYVFISVNHRLTPKKNARVDQEHPIHVSDVAQAVAWIHKNIASYCGAPEKIVLMGHSAGAGIVSLLATDPSHLREAGVDPSVIKGLVSNDTGAYDVTFQMTRGTATARRIYRRAFGKEPRKWAAASALRHARSQGGASPPAALIIYRGWRGRRDMAERFAEALERAGSEVTTFHAEGLTHREVDRRSSLAGDPIAEAILRLLEAAAEP